METLLDGVNHIALLTRDMDRFIRFYQEVFDATVVHDNRNHAGHVGERMVILALGGQSAFNVFEVPGNTQAQIQTPQVWAWPSRPFWSQCPEPGDLRASAYPSHALRSLGWHHYRLRLRPERLLPRPGWFGGRSRVEQRPGDAGCRKSHRLKRRACDGYGEFPRGDIDHCPITTGSYWIPEASWVKFVVTGCFYRLSPRVAADAASLEKAMSYQVLQSFTGCKRPQKPISALRYSPLA
jgi:catechol 2,3-dioxygenase-like lactoylglutathione lyase family enzyme